MNKIKCLIASMLLATTVSAQAEFIDGSLLLSRMLGTEVDQVYALAYTIGVADATNGSLWCSPEQMKSIEVLNLTKAVLIASPGRRHLSADVFVAAALKRAYPCPPKAPPPGSKSL